MSDEALKQLVWEKGRAVLGYDSKFVRKDACGAWMSFEDYNDRNSPFGWEIDHVYPKSKLEKLNVPDELINHIDNLRPMNWHNNVSKDDDYPVYQATVKSEDDHNIACEEEKYVNKRTRDKIVALFKDYSI